MSDTVATAPVAPATDAPVETKAETKAGEVPTESQRAKRDTMTERKKSAAAGLRDFLDGKAEKPSTDAPKKDSAQADKPAEKGATEDTATSKTEAKIELVTDAIEAAGGEAPEQKNDESDKQYELRLARTLRDLKDAKAEAVQEKKRATEAEKKAADLEKRIARAKSPETVLEALEDFGWSLESLAKGVVDKKVTIPGKKASLPPEMQARIDALEAQAKRLEEQEKNAEAQRQAAEKEKQAEEQRQAAEKTKSEHVSKVKSYVTENAEDFPFLSAAEWAAAEAVERAYAKKAANVRPILEEMEAMLTTNVASMLKSDKAAKALFQASPDLRDAVMAALGVSAEKPEPKEKSEKPKTIASKAVPSETGSSHKKLTAEERKKSAAKELAEFLKAQREG